MDKLTLMFVILGFWLILPIPFMLMGFGEYDTVDIDTNAAIGTFIIAVGEIYLKTLILSIPNVHLFINLFLLLLKLGSIIGTYLMIRGN